MKKYCPNCEHVFYEDDLRVVLNENSEFICPDCCTFLINEDKMTYEQARTLSRAAHNRDIEAYNKSQSAMCFIIIGGTVLIIGILFIFLSLEKKFNKIVGINFISFQFAIATIGILTGVTLLTLGTIFLIKALKRRKAAKRDINTLATLKEKLR